MSTTTRTDNGVISSHARARRVLVAEAVQTSRSNIFASSTGTDRSLPMPPRPLPHIPINEEEAQTIASFVEGPGVRIELHTAAVNGLHANDFVLAAKLDKVDLGDVTVKKKPNVFLV